MRTRYVMALLSVCVFSLGVATTGWAHVGRRFEVKTESVGSLEKLYTLGYSSGGVDDGGGVTRSYRNAIHDHWSNIFGSATASLPGLDVLVPGNLEGHSLYAELVGVTKWVDPPLVNMGGMMMVPEGTVPTLDPLGSENLFVGFDSQAINASSLGTLTLDNSIAAAGAHLDLIYGIDVEPESVLYSLEWVLSTDAPGVLDSDSIYIILAPDGSNMMEKMHMESLYLESYLGTPLGVAVPEPSTMVLGGVAIMLLGVLRIRVPGDGATR